MDRVPPLVALLAAACMAVLALAAPWLSPLSALLVLGGALAVALFLERRLRPGYQRRSAAVAALTMIGCAPALGYATQLALATPPLALDASSIAVAAAFAFAGIAASFAVASCRPGARAVPTAAAIAAIACTASVIGSLPGRLAGDAAMPDLVSSLAVERCDEHCARFNEALPASPGRFALGKSCIGDSCFAYVRSGDQLRSLGPLVARDATLSLRHDPASGVLLLSADARPVALADARLHDARWRAPGPAPLVSLAPWSFLLLGTMALAGVVVWLFSRRRLARALGRVPMLAAGEVDGGWLHLEGAHPPRRVGDDAGGVLLLGDAPPTRAYRGDRGDAAVRLFHGDRAALTEALASRLETADARALGWIVLFSTPLWCAMLSRLL